MKYCLVQNQQQKKALAQAFTFAKYHKKENKAKVNVLAWVAIKIFCALKEN